MIMALWWRMREAYYYLLNKILGDFVVRLIYYRHKVHGQKSRLFLSDSANLNNALFNVASGDIIVGDYVFCGRNVLFFTGTHDYTKKRGARQLLIPLEGRDVVIGAGVWIGSNSVILGPCIIGENAVIAASSLVNKDVPPDAIFGGVPAKHLKDVKYSE